MADNVAITQGSGTSIAADDIGGVLHQRVKLALGADGTGVDAVAGNGVSGTGVQRVTLASDSTGQVAVTGNVATTVADGADVGLGTTTDAAAAADNSTATLIALTKRNNQNLSTINTSINTAATTSAPVAPATATATNSTLIGGQYNSAGVALTNGQQGSAQLDAYGSLRAIGGDVLLGPYTSSADGVLFDIDTTGFESIAVHTTTAGVGTHTFTTSNLQAATYVATVGYAPGSSGSTIAVGTIASAASMLLFPKTGRFFKDTISGYTSTPSVIYVLLCKKPVVSQIQAFISNGGFQTQGSAVGTVGLLQVLDARTAAPTAVTTATGVRAVATVYGAQVVRQNCIPELEWNYAAATSGIANTTTAVTIKTASGNAAIRSYITGIQFTSEALGTATELAVRDGAGGTVLWKIKIGTGGMPGGMAFPVNLKSSLNTLLEVVTLTASTTGAVYFNAQGYDAP